MITSVHIENFKCFKQFDIDLGTFNVLVGPNGSGKTAFMRVIQMACALGRNPVATLGSLVEGGLEMDADLAWQNRLDSDVIIRICANAGEKDMEGLCGVIHVDLHRQGQPEFGLEAVTRTVAESPEVAKGWLARRVNTSNPAGLAVKWARAALGGCKYYRLDPAELRQPSGPSGQSFSMTARGTGFPTYLMDILRHDREAFFDVEKAFYARFPEYRRVELPEVIGD
jgi:energy-coupling factor transporter ATP-binding protein EcfA2